MLNFSQTGKQLHNAQKQKESARIDLHKAKEKLEHIKAAQKRLDRYFDPTNSDHQTLRQKLDGDQAQVQADINQKQSALTQAQQSFSAVINQFLPFTDPRQNLNQKSHSFPFLMFPVRIETRFKEVTIPGTPTEVQMWVRFYPDECLVDTFEDVPSDSELDATTKFWVDWVKSGQVENQQRGAWGSFVFGSGPGRCAWLMEQYGPPATATFPSKADDHDVILVIATEQPLPAAEKPLVETFWQDWWKADGDVIQEQNAYNALISGLDGLLGAGQGNARAEVIFERYAPENLDDNPSEPLTRADVSVQVTHLELPDRSSFDSQRQPWSQAPRVNILPERFVLLGWKNDQLVLNQLGNVIPAPLIAGPDPLADPAEQMKLQNGDLEVGPEMKWMVDFDEAEAKGMAMRVNLTTTEARAGFDQLMVVGVRMQADEEDSQELIETLFKHHEQGNSGFSLLPQGTPTNNTEDEGSGFSENEDADESYDLYFGNPTPLTWEENYLDKTDGQWLADMLGLDLTTFDKTLHARGRDMTEARAMNAALWPATWGYFMDTMMGPVFQNRKDDPIEATRFFFNNFVLARGVIPSVRIGEQPYGILPTTAFSRLEWTENRDYSLPMTLDFPHNFGGYLEGLHTLLNTLKTDWEAQLSKVAYIGKGGVDPHQSMLDALGLHPTSAEFYQRYSESMEQFINRMKLQGIGGQIVAAIVALGYVPSGMSLLNKLGYSGKQIPEILEKIFLKTPIRIPKRGLPHDFIIDDQKLSEINPVRAYTSGGDNYIQWLITAAGTSFDTLRKQNGFIDDKRPSALLYYMLRHALELSFYEVSLALFRNAELISSSQYRQAKLDPSFIHVGEPAANAPSLDLKANNLPTSGKPINLDQRSESRYEYLYQSAPAITGDPNRMVAEHIPTLLGTNHFATAYLEQQLEGLEYLKNTPTARLERVFTEHIDLCTYRLDAWRWGLLNFQLASLRYDTEGPNGEAMARPGVYVGAYGYLEDVKTEFKTLTPVDLSSDPDLDAEFNPQGSSLPPIVRDDKNGGYIHAPSLNQAITAAILRNGYLANATPSNPDTLKINLSSERVRSAMGIIEGIRNGQKLGALLGYHFERGLHDRHGLVEVDKFIYDIRRVFPLVADKINKTRKADEDGIRTVEARNVVDGYRLINHIKSSGNKTYPWGKSLQSATAAEAAAINEEVDRIMDIQDAVADLVMAEGIFQTVQGNFGRVASNLDAYAKGTFPPEPEVVQTPRSGINLTHRMGLHLEPGLPPGPTPRSHSEPALNKWLAGLLPDPGLIFCKVSYFDPSDNTSKEVEVTQQQLGLEPLDLLYLVNPEEEQAMTALDDRIVLYVLQNQSPRWDVPIEIEYAGKESGKYSFFEVGAILRPLRRLVLKARPLNASDVALPNETNDKAASQVLLDANRISTPLSEMVQVRNSGGAPDDLSKFATDLAAPLADTSANRATIISNIDTWIDRAMTLFSQANGFGVTQAGTGFAYDWKQAVFGRIRGVVQEILDRWQDKLDAYDDLINNQYPAATDDDARNNILRQAEEQVSTAFTTPIPATPANYLTAVQAKHSAFTSKMSNFEGFMTAPNTAVSTFLQNLEAELPIDDFDLETYDLTEIEDEVVRFAQDLATQVNLLSAEIDERQTKCQDQLDAAAAASSAPDRIEALKQAAKILFGEDYLIVPEFTVPSIQADEWQKAWDDRTVILNYLTGPAPGGLEMDFPVDEWLYGVARVRPEAAQWERITMLSRAFGNGEPELSPIQLPYVEQDQWLAMPFEEPYDFDQERLLYTAHYAIPFDKTANQCGLLLDEWTEVIPTREETTGLTFHYDRPNSEPPQAMLLVTHPTMDGDWQWDYLVDGIRETFSEARLRAVEPTQIDDTAYARFLPATISAVTIHPITIALNYSMVNQVYQYLNTEEDA